MCVIIQLPAKKIMSAEKVRNAVLNNPDGFGLVFVDRGKLTVRKDCPADGNDPDEIYKILQDSFGVDRYLHVRKNTVGKTNVENAHPFTVFKSGDRQIEFMHNGTIGTYRPQTGSDLSDTRNYAQTFLAPLLERFKGEKGMGDYTDPFFYFLVKGVFDYSNRGLLISNDLPIREFGPWEDIKDGDETFRASNDSYFRSVFSGRVKDQGVSGNNDPRFRRIVETPTQEALALITNQGRTDGTPPVTAHSVTPLKDINLSKVVSKDIKADDLNDLMDLSVRDFADIEDEQLSFYQYISRIELEGWVRKHPATAAAFLELILTRHGEAIEAIDALNSNLDDEVEKHSRATKRVEELVFELNERDKHDAVMAASEKSKVNRPVRTRTKKVA